MAPSQKLTLMETTSTTKTNVSSRFTVTTGNPHQFVEDFNRWIKEQPAEVKSLTIEINGLIYS